MSTDSVDRRLSCSPASVVVPNPILSESPVKKPSTGPTSLASSSSSESLPPNVKVVRKQRRSKLPRRVHRRGHYQVTPPLPVVSDQTSPARSSPASSFVALPPEPWTSSDSSSSSSSSSSASSSSASQASFDLSDCLPNHNPTPVPNASKTQLAVAAPLVSRSLLQLELRGQSNNNSNKLQRHLNHSSQQQQQPRNSLTFWDLITDVAKDLDLELQDLSPDVEIFEEEKGSSLAKRRSDRIAHVGNTDSAASTRDDYHSHQTDQNSNQSASGDAPVAIGVSSRPDQHSNGHAIKPGHNAHYHHSRRQSSQSTGMSCQYNQQQPPHSPLQTPRAFNPEDYPKYRNSHPDYPDAKAQVGKQFQQQQPQSQSQQPNRRITSSSTALPGASHSISHIRNSYSQQSGQSARAPERRKQQQLDTIGNTRAKPGGGGTSIDHSTSQRLLLKSTLVDSRPLSHPRRFRDQLSSAARRPSLGKQSPQSSSFSTTTTTTTASILTPTSHNPQVRSSNLGRRRLTGSQRANGNGVLVVPAAASSLECKSQSSSSPSRAKSTRSRPTVVGSILKSEYRPSRFCSKVSPASDSRDLIKHSLVGSVVQPLCLASKSVRIANCDQPLLLPLQPPPLQPPPPPPVSHLLSNQSPSPMSPERPTQLNSSQDVSYISFGTLVGNDERIKIPRASLPPQHPHSSSSSKAVCSRSAQSAQAEPSRARSPPPHVIKPHLILDNLNLPEGNVDDEEECGEQEEEEVVDELPVNEHHLTTSTTSTSDHFDVDTSCPGVQVTNSQSNLEPSLVDRTRRITISDEPTSVAVTLSTSSSPSPSSSMSQSDQLELETTQFGDSKQDQPQQDLEERLRLTHQIWLLPEVNRATVVHYLQGRSVGVFIVRQSSKPNTMALSVRLPQGRGPHVEHYLIEKRNTSKSAVLFRLEGSEHYFGTIHSLVLHYAHCCDELPVKLTLPPVLLSCSASQLVSLALLDQQFWQSKFVSLKQLPKNSLNTETLAEQVGGSKPALAECQPAAAASLLLTVPTKRNNPSSVSSDSLSSNLSLTSVSSHHSALSSISPVPLPRRSLQRRNKNRTTPIQDCPPIPPKGDILAANSDSPLVDSRKSSVVVDKVVVIAAAGTTPQPHLIPSIQSDTPKLPPRITEPPPPPIPPRTPRCNDPATSKESTKTPKPGVKAESSSFSISELLSPISMTESEIEIVKLANRAERQLECPSPSPPLLTRSSNTNYYNHHPKQTGSVAQPPSLSVCKAQPTSKQSPVESAESVASNCCDVYTQTAVNAELSSKNQLEASKARPSSSLSMTSSSYYMDPVDAIAAIQFSRRQQRLSAKESFTETLSHSSKRHSDPELGSNNSAWNTLGRHNSLQSLLETFRNRFPNATATVTTTTTSISVAPLEPVENVAPRSSVGGGDQQRRADLVGGGGTKPDAGFSTVDSTWQWHGVNQSPTQQTQIGVGNSIKSDTTTVEDRIGLRAPELAVPKVAHLNEQSSRTEQNEQAGSSGYDNLDRANHHQHTHNRVCPNSALQTGTNQTDPNSSSEFSEPWNLDNLVETMFLPEDCKLRTRPESRRFDTGNNLTHQLLKTDLINFNSFLLLEDNSTGQTGAGNPDDSDDYDNVTEDYEDGEEDIYGEYDIRQHPGSKGRIEREDSESTLKDHNQNYYRNDRKGSNSALKDLAERPESVMLSIVHNLSQYVFELADRKDNTFGKSIDNFIDCTKDSAESNPTVILGYIRQFMNGMKNYLLKHGEGQFLQIVQRERDRLKSNQFLNIDSILECALQKLVIKPLKSYIYDLFIKSLQASGSLKHLSHNIKLAQANCAKAAQQFGVRPELLPLKPDTMAEIQNNLRRLQQSYSPIKKLEHLLRCIAIVSGESNGNLDQQQDRARPQLSGDDLLPMLVYIIVQCGLISAEVEIEYMLGLLHPSILNGEGSYYLTVFSSSVQMLKNMYVLDDTAHRPSTDQNHQSLHQSALAIFRDLKNSTQIASFASNIEMDQCSPGAAAANQSQHHLQANIKILFPNELTSSITCKTVPIRHNMTSKEVCRMLAHRFRITNPEDYGLFSVVAQNVQREDVQLLDSDCPQQVRSERIARKECSTSISGEPLFAYKRCDAKFIWPSSVSGESS